MGFGRGLLLWLIGIPLPIIILLALYSGAAKATSFPTLSPMAPRSSARAGW
jgi:hypothetical protein